MRLGLIVVYVFSFLAVAFLVIALFPPNLLTGFATSETIGSNVTVENFFAIEISANLNDGINFDEITSLPANNVNSTDNYNDGSSRSSMFINVSSDSDTNVDFCIKVNSGLTDSSSATSIGVGNESYANASTTDSNVPSVDEEVSLTTNYAKSSVPVVPGNSTYYRFWLDVPLGIESGTYNNTVNFKGVIAGRVC